jgi:uncharacterized protein (DUF427 family)
MVKAKWNGAIIAESNETKAVEGNQYFPAGSVKKEYLVKSSTTSVCSWKGTASYYDVKVGDAVNKDAAWYYSDPKDAAKQIAGYIAFWKGVEVTTN